MGKKRERNVSLDVIRSLAVFTVLTVHFQLNNGFYNQPVTGEKMLIMTFIRTFSGICVPLFLLLTGYLMNKKTVSKKYYGSITKVLVIYLFASISYRLYRIIYFGETFTPKEWILDILGFSATRYTWYVEMYIGLFLLIPFLNLIWNGLETKKKRIILIATMLAVTTLPSVLNVFNFFTEGWWQSPVISGKYSALVPDWWTEIYPITYYFLGCYLREYGLKMRRCMIAVWFAVTLVVATFFNYYRSWGGKFVKGEWVDWQGWQCIILSVLIFAFIEKCNFNNKPKWIKQIFITVSNLSFGIYLASGLFDNYAYAKLNAAVENIPTRLNYFIVIVPFVFICSLVLSAVWEGIYALLSELIGIIKRKITGVKNV